MVVLAVTWMANPGREEQVAQIFTKLQAASRQEPGCLMYVVHRHRTGTRGVSSSMSNIATMPPGRRIANRHTFRSTSSRRLGTLESARKVSCIRR